MSQTDASYRFERGVDDIAIPDRLGYAVELITRVAGGVRDGDPTDAHTAKLPAGAIRVRLERIARVLGEEIPVDEIEHHLRSIEFIVNRDAGDLLVTPPSFREDVAGEVEVIEEIARLHGYEKFSSEIRPFRPGTVPDAPLELVSRKVRRDCVQAGLLEARPMPFVREGDESLRVRNPLAEDEAYLRTSLLNSLARRVEFNFSHMARNVRLFEIGTVYTLERETTGAPGERMHAAAVLAGDRRPAHFTEPRPPHYDEWDAKGLALVIARAAYIGAEVECVASVGDSLWTVTIDDIAVGTVQRLGLDAPVGAAGLCVEIDME